MDRNVFGFGAKLVHSVALRKESVDRNEGVIATKEYSPWSLSARRARIEIAVTSEVSERVPSLSARRAWIEITPEENPTQKREGRSPQGERG